MALNVISKIQFSRGLIPKNTPKITPQRTHEYTAMDMVRLDKYLEDYQKYVADCWSVGTANIYTRCLKSVLEYLEETSTTDPPFRYDNKTFFLMIFCGKIKKQLLSPGLTG